MASLKRKRLEQCSVITQSLGEADHNVLNIIKGKKDLAIAVAEIKRVSKLPAKQVDKSIKTLTTNQLIKEVHNIKHKGKHYMAAEFEPPKELTGGQWYADGRLDQVFIDSLKEICLKIVRHLKVVTAKGVHQLFIKHKEVVSEEVSYQQIVEILRLMVLENEILEVKSTGLAEYHSIPVGEVCYRCVIGGGGLGEASKATGAMASMPCGVCPRINLCTPDGVISPTTCVYYTKWLDF